MHTTTNKRIAGVLGLIILIAVGLYTSLYFFYQPKSQMGDANLPAITGDTKNLVSFSLASGATITDIAHVSGEIKGVYFFEGKAQGFLLDENKKVLNTFPLEATSNWLTADGVSFTASIDTTSALPGAGYIRLKNDNPSGDPEKDKFIDIPIVIQ